MQTAASRSETPSANTAAREIETGRKATVARMGWWTTSMIIASGISEISRFTSPDSTVATMNICFGM